MRVQSFWAIVGGFCLGVLLRSFVPLGWGFILFLGSMGLVFGVFTKRKHIIFSLLIVAMACGVARMHLGIISPDIVLDSYVAKKVTLVGRIIAEPDIRESSARYHIQADTLRIASTSVPIRAGVLVVALRQAPVRLGDVVQVAGTLHEPESFEGSGGRIFEYPGYLAKDGILYRVDFAHVEREEWQGKRPVWLVPRMGAVWIKQHFERGLSRALPEPAAGLAAGITVGEKRGVGKEWSETFRTAGLTHIIVLSGYNIMIVMYWCARMLAYLRLRKSVEYIASASVAVFFMLMTGFAAAGTRAALMALIAIVGEAAGRRYIAVRALGVVVASMVAGNPYVLVFDPGFQLSIVATFGILMVTPLMARHLSGITEAGGFRELCATTIGTQLTVLPLLLYQMGNLSIVALPANILVLVAVPYAMGFSVLAGVGGMFAGPLASLAGLPAYALLSYILGATDFFARLPYASVTVPAFSAWWLVPVYAALWMYVVSQKGEPARKVASAPVVS